MRKTLIIAALTALLAVPAYAQDDGNAGPAPASDAAGQLNNATSGTQSTGQTFDGGYTPTDAYPTGNTPPPPDPTPSSSSGDASSPQ